MLPLVRGRSSADVADSLPFPSARPLSPGDVRRSLKLSLVDGLLHAIMVGASESYLGALAVELGHTDQSLALLATLPLLAGAFTQLFSERMTSFFGSRRRFVVAGATLQAASQVAFATIALLEVTSLAPLLLAKLFFWVSGSMIAPAWGAWMGRLTENVRRERYFAFRSSATQLVLLVAFTGAGGFLGHNSEGGLWAFAVLHVIAGVARLGSALALSRKADVRDDVSRDEERRPPLLESLQRGITGARWRVALYMGALMFCAHISVPFYTPYMLKDLGLGYLAFASVTSVSILTKAVTFPFLHHLAARFGMRAVLAVGGLGIASVALAWAFVKSFAGLVVVQAVSGAAWGAVEFASFQLLLQSARPEIRLAFLSLASCLQGAMQVGGALLGSLVLSRVQLPYTDVFMISGIGRALPLLLLLGDGSVRRMRGVRRLFSRIESVRPGGGVIRRLWPASRDEEV